MHLPFSVRCSWPHLERWHSARIELSNRPGRRAVGFVETPQKMKYRIRTRFFENSSRVVGSPFVKRTRQYALSLYRQLPSLWLNNRFILRPRFLDRHSARKDDQKTALDSGRQKGLPFGPGIHSQCDPATATARAIVGSFPSCTCLDRNAS